jgi:hypothetical protein
LPAVELDVPDRESVSVQIATLANGVQALRLELSPTTPPGSYTGRVRLPDGEWPLTADVVAHPHLVAISPPGELAAEPGGQVEFELEVVNAGNVQFELRAAYRCWLFDVGGLSRSLVAGLTADVHGSERVGVVAEELAASGGGVARIRVHDGSGPIEPGEARTLRASAELDPNIRPGRSYVGYWSLQQPVCTLTITISALAPKEDR